MGTILLSPSFGKMQQDKTPITSYYPSDRSSKKFASEDGQNTMVMSDQYEIRDVLDLPDHDVDEGDEEDGRGMPYNNNRDSFYNYAAFDALRPGEEVKSLLSWRYVGLAVSAMGYGFAYMWVFYPLKQLLMEYQNVHFPKLWQPILMLYQWPEVIPLFVGVLSDCYPIFRYRRKSWIILGWLITFFSSIGMVVMYCVGDQKSKNTMIFSMVNSCILWFGIEMAWTCTLAMSVEYAQRERLHQRGRLQTTMFMFRYGTESVTMLIAATFLWPDAAAKHYTAAISLGATGLILALASLVPIPFVVYCMEEEPVPAHSRVTLASRLVELWRLLSQRAVYTIVLAMAAMSVFISANYSPLNTSIRMWGGFQQKNAIWLLLGVYPVRFLAAWIWNRFMINSNWRVFMGSALFLGTMFRMGSSMIIANNILRSKVLFIIQQAAIQIALGWTVMLEVIPTTEAIQVGREGTTLGLIFTAGQLVTLACGAFWSYFQKWVKLDLTINDINKDSAHTRRTATLMLLAINGYAALSTIVVFFLPGQKLDSQQLRAFGGRHNVPRYVVAVGLVAIFCFDLWNNLSRALNQ